MALLITILCRGVMRGFFCEFFVSFFARLTSNFLRSSGVIGLLGGNWRNLGLCTRRLGGC